LRVRFVSVVLCGVVALSGCSSGASGRPAASKQPRPSPSPSPSVEIPPGGIGPAYFGMHDSDPVGDSWPAASVGSLRVWDSGVAWNQVETAPGSYDFSRLDAIVQTARDRGADVLIVLGQTPAFYAKRPKVVGSYGAGASSMPDLDAWAAYVRAVVTRYTGADVAFQVWNEANVAGYWSGTPKQMARLTAVVRSVMDEVGSTQTLVAPAMATRLLSHRAYYREFYTQRVGGRPVWELVDVLSFQFYPEYDAPLEQSVDLLEATRALLSLEGVPADLPIWNTEINYGLQGGLQALPIDDSEQAANVARTLVLNAAYGVDRVYWYSWDLQAIANTSMVSETGEVVTPAGKAWDEVREWLLGTVPSGCSVIRGKTYVCTFSTADGEERTVYWNPKRETEIRTPFDAQALQKVGVAAVDVPLGGTTFTVGDSPVLVASGPPRSAPPGPVAAVAG